jgi:hypothetical protein
MAVKVVPVASKGHQTPTLHRRFTVEQHITGKAVVTAAAVLEAEHQCQVTICSVEVLKALFVSCGESAVLSLTTLHKRVV